MNIQFNYYWRLFATAVSFISFGIAGIFLWLIIYPILRVIPGSQNQKIARAQKSVHYSFYIFIGLMHRLGVMSYEIKGLEKLNRPGQLILANHPTLVDIVFIISRIPFASCIVKENLWHNPFIRGSVINAGYISNADSEKMIRDSVDYLKAGGSMVIFPEGTRTVLGKPYKFQRGAARIALQANTIVTPVFISCLPGTLSKQQKWYQIPDRQFHLVMQVGDDIVLDDFLAIEPHSIGVRRFNRYLQEYFSNGQI